MNKLTFEEKRRKVLSLMLEDMKFTDIVDAYYKDYSKYDISDIEFPKEDISIAAEEAREKVIKAFNLDGWQVGGKRNNVIVMTSRNYTDNDKAILDFFKKLGYFPAVHSTDIYKVHNKLYTQWSIIQLEPIYQDNINDEVYGKRWLAHLTPVENVDKILKEGIIPFNKNELFNYIERCYFFERDMVTFHDLKKYCKKLNDAYINRKENAKYCILKIDTEKLDNVNFYKDYNWINGSVYTQQRIPPNAISIEDYINII